MACHDIVKPILRGYDCWIAKTLLECSITFQTAATDDTNRLIKQLDVGMSPPAFSFTLLLIGQTVPEIYYQCSSLSELWGGLFVQSELWSSHRQTDRK